MVLAILYTDRFLIYVPFVIDAIEQGPLARKYFTALPNRRVLYTISQKGQVAVHAPFAAAIHAAESLHEVHIVLVSVQNGQ